MLAETGGDTGIQQIGKICGKKERKLIKSKRPEKRKTFPPVGVEPRTIISKVIALPILLLDTKK